jgi:hypothetical protein
MLLVDHFVRWLRSHCGSQCDGDGVFVRLYPIGFRRRELAVPFQGLIRVSSAPLHDVITQLGQ